jgi:DNA-binding XRE family transcriptional regulator
MTEPASSTTNPGIAPTPDAPPAAVADPDERDFLRSLGKRVRLLRIDHELTQEQLAHGAGMSRNFVSSIERGAHGVDLVRVRRLALALDVEIDALVPPVRPDIRATEPVTRWPA